MSTNCIEKISSLSGMESLKILSLGRNLLKKIENLDAVAETLEELWVSYNQITGLVSCMLAWESGCSQAVKKPCMLYHASLYGISHAET